MCLHLHIRSNFISCTSDDTSNHRNQVFWHENHLFLFVHMCVWLMWHCQCGNMTNLQIKKKNGKTPPKVRSRARQYLREFAPGGRRAAIMPTAGINTGRDVCSFINGGKFSVNTNTIQYMLRRRDALFGRKPKSKKMLKN